MANPISMVLLISTYLYVIRNGKKFMEPQKPYNIQKIIIVYNILQILTNLGLFLAVSRESILVGPWYSPIFRMDLFLPKYVYVRTR